MIHVISSYISLDFYVNSIIYLHASYIVMLHFYVLKVLIVIVSYVYKVVIDYIPINMAYYLQLST